MQINFFLLIIFFAFNLFDANAYSSVKPAVGDRESATLPTNNDESKDKSPDTVPGLLSLPTPVPTHAPTPVPTPVPTEITPQLFDTTGLIVGLAAVFAIGYIAATKIFSNTV